MRTIALDHTEIGALDFFIRGITISAFQTFAAASNAKAFPGLARIDHIIIPRPALWTTHSVGALSITQQLVASMREIHIPQIPRKRRAPRACPLQPEERVFLRSGRFGRGNFLLGLCLFFFELETDLSVFQFQISRKGASFFGNKFVQEIGSSRRNEFLYFFFWNLAMQDVFTDAKGACLGRCDGFFSRVLM